MASNSPEQVKFVLTATTGAYVTSEAVVNVIYSPRGEGKTVASIAAVFHHAKRNKKPITCAIVRDTHENIKLSVARSVQKVLPPNRYKFKNDYKELMLYSNPPILVDLFGIADPGALQKLQGSEYALVWLEEPAPMVDNANAGLSEDVFNAALIVCARQTDCFPRLQVSMNPADQDHWTYKRFFEEPNIDPDNPLITKAVFEVPYGDNPYLPEISRQATKAAYKHDPASYARYVGGKFVAITQGKKVTPDYGTGNYTSLKPLRPAKGLEGFMSFDGWQDPVAVLGQILPTGRLVFIDTLVGNNIDIRILIDQKVRPMLNSPRWKDMCKSWRHMGDRSMKIPDQSNINESAAKVVENAFKSKTGRHAHFEGGPARWEHMKRGIDKTFAKNIVGKTAFIVNKNNRLLDKALSGGWAYKVDNAGNVVSDIPMKNASSHVGDAWANAINVLMPTNIITLSDEKLKKLQEKTRNRAKSYAVG